MTAFIREFPGFIVGLGAGVGVTFVLGQLASYYGLNVSLMGQQEESEDEDTEGKQKECKCTLLSVVRR